MVCSSIRKQYGYERNLSSSSDISPKNRSDVYALEPGTYAIKIRASGSRTGSYRVKTSFKAANNNESAANDKFETAQQLKLGQFVTGFLSIDDTVDFYRIHLSAPAAVRLIYTSYISGSYFQVWNQDLIEVSKKEVYTASEESPKTYVYEQALQAGTYYIKIYPYGSRTGRYQLKYESKELVKSITVSGNKRVSPGKSFTLKAAVSPSNASNKEVKWTSGDSSVAYVDETTGVVTANKPGVTNITCQAQDGSNVTRVTRVIVVPRKMGTLYLSKRSKSSVKISWDHQYNISGYQLQYSPYKSMKSAKTKRISKSKYYTTIKKLTAKKYYFRLRAYTKVSGKYYYGKWSSKKSIRLRK